MEKVKQRYFDIIVCVLVSVLVLVPIIRLGNLPGLYMDAVNPDYTAVQILFPREGQIKWMVAWPWLTQMYHGNINVILSLLSILVTGAASVLRHHILYGILCIICIMLLYRLLTIQEVGASRYIAAVIAVITATLPAIMVLSITQYYIELFGTACILSGFLCFCRWKRNQTKKRWILAAYLLFGVAFYSYFNFLFFLPSLLAGTFFFSRRKEQNQIGVLLQCVIFYLFGCSFYFIGYTQIYISATCSVAESRNMILLVFAIAFYGLLAVLYWLSKKQGILRVAGIMTGLVLAAGWAFTLLPVLLSYMENINIAGSSAGVVERVYLIFMWLSISLNAMGAEQGIYMAVVTFGCGGIWLCTLSIAAILLILEGVEGKLRAYSPWKAILGSVLIYIICTVFFASRVQGQHFVPLFFMMMLLLGASLAALQVQYSMQDRRQILGISLVAVSSIAIALVYIIKRFQTKNALEQYFGMARYLEKDLKYTVPIFLLLTVFFMIGILKWKAGRRRIFSITVLLVIVLGLNLVNEERIINEIERTGGVHFYSHQINQLAKEALEHAANGTRELYVFDDWGFMFGFNYLTENKIEIAGWSEPEYLSGYVEEGYRVVICYWDSTEKDRYEDVLERAGGDSENIENEVRYQNDGGIAFYVTSLGMQK